MSSPGPKRACATQWTIWSASIPRLWGSDDEPWVMSPKSWPSSRRPAAGEDRRVRWPAKKAPAPAARRRSLVNRNPFVKSKSVSSRDGG